MNIFELFASLKLDKSEYEKGINEAEKQGDNFANHTQNKISPKVVAGWMAIVAVIAKVVQTVAKLARESMNYADTVGDLAAKFGVTTDAISEMQYIADQSSTSVEQLTTSMSMLYMRAKQDGEAFKQLGVSVKDSNGNFKAMDELFWETIGALNTLEDENAKNAYMLDWFGRSAMNVGEVLRKTNEEIKTMRKEAHELGIVLDETTIDFASDWNDQIAVLKLQMNSVMVSMVAGAPDAEERFDKFMGNLLETAEKYLPRFVRFFVRFLTVIGNALMSYAPTLIADVIGIAIEEIFKVNWFQVGVDIAISIVEGVLNVVTSVVNGFLRLIGGGEIPKIDFGRSGNYQYWSDIGVGSQEYEISENTKQTIEIKVEASGDTAVSEDTAEKTAQALAPYIDKILGGK